MTSYSQLSYSQLECRAVSTHTTKCCSVDCDPLLSVESLQSCAKMPRSRKFRCEADWSSSNGSDAESTTTVVENLFVGAPTMAVGAQPGTVLPAPAADATGGDWESDSTATAVTSRPRGAKYTEPTVPFPPRKCPKCTLGTVFDTQMAFALHLKNKHGSYWCPKSGHCLSYSRRRKKGAKATVRDATASKSTHAATATGQSHQHTTSASQHAPVPLMDMVGGLGLPWPCQP